MNFTQFKRKIAPLHPGNHFLPQGASVPGQSLHGISSDSTSTQVPPLACGIATDLCLVFFPVPEEPPHFNVQLVHAPQAAITQLVGPGGARE